ncbi:HAMP domain-containing sensor histidine kinase [Jeotgalibacillus sp. ET6]|uniref:sensor histidine kinase n=1 Tax=Jeotgalibacillus sp. ET6 TaxID=3037260 RepID=UPI0024184016|nr:HAMP domain-containing sensor histidine kinase [Jeotgalibacillus sp. ET6]MDG5472176.1 HAMP domain-containing sensor histidine kinase [Jeotgalibacillus sp. ET6]
MKKSKLNFSRKIVLLLVGSVALSLVFSFVFLYFLYKDLYLNTIRESVEYQGQRTAAHYHYGELSEEIIEKIHWYNVVSEYEVIVVDEIDELNESFPYTIGNENLVTEEDRELLLQGDSMMKEGYVETFGREVIGAIYPINDGEEVIGFIYIYVPLAGLSQVFGSSIPLLFGIGILFFLGVAYLIRRIQKSLFQPLVSIQDLSKEVSKGNYENRIEIRQMDEIGQMATAFNEMSEALEHQEERKKEFLSNVVHELRTPLTYINGYTEVLKNELYASAEEEKQYLETIEQEVGRLKKLLSDLVDLNHLQDDLFHFDHEPIALGGLLYETADLFKILAAKKEIEMTFDVDEELIILNDAKRIQQIFYNLLDNAVKYSHPKSIIFLNLHQEENDFVFEVANRGDTLSKEEQDRMGERFYRTDRARNRGTGGTGLGLSIVKEIVRIQSGEFTVKSKDNGLINVAVRLPAQKEAQQE